MEMKVYVAKSFGANYEIVQMWVKQFESHGIHAFKKGYTSYSMEYKLDVLNYINDNETSPNETAIIFNISSPALIRKWRTQLHTQGINALASKKKGRLSMTKKNQKLFQNQTTAEGSVGK